MNFLTDSLLQKTFKLIIFLLSILKPEIINPFVFPYVVLFSNHKENHAIYVL